MDRCDPVFFSLVLSVRIFLPLSRSSSAVSSDALREQNDFSLGNDQPTAELAELADSRYDLAYGERPNKNLELSMALSKRVEIS